MKNINEHKGMIIGIGNVAKGDDALGWAFIDLFKHELDNCAFEYKYQLGPEDSEVIAHFDWILIVDASYVVYDNGYYLSEVKATKEVDFFSHSFKPDHILHLCEKYFRRSPETWLLEICGHNFKLGNGLTNLAVSNLIQAGKTVEKFLLDRYNVRLESTT